MFYTQIVKAGSAATVLRLAMRAVMAPWAPVISAITGAAVCQSPIPAVGPSDVIWHACR
jgi:hypothetical protein